MTRKRYAIPNKNKLRNLIQYRDLSEEEFENEYDKLITGHISSEAFENRIEKQLESFSEDYDIDDLKINDRLVLRGLAQAYLTLEDLESHSFSIRKDGISTNSILELEKVNNMMSVLRRDISNMQNDLKITRKIRKGDKEESVLNYIEDLKNKAKEFYDKKMFYVWCDKCNMLLFTGWFLYPDEINKVNLTCHRTLEDGSICKNKVSTTSKELLELRGVNVENVPEFFK